MTNLRVQLLAAGHCAVVVPAGLTDQKGVRTPVLNHRPHCFQVCLSQLTSEL